MRSQINISNSFLFSREFTIKENQLDGGILEHIELLKLLREARIQFLAKYGMREDNIQDGIGATIRDLQVEYVKPAFLNDHLKVNITLGTMYSKGCEIVYQVDNTTRNQITAKAKTSIVFLSLDKSHQVVPVPEKFKSLADELRPMPQFSLSKL